MEPPNTSASANNDWLCVYGKISENNYLLDGNGIIPAPFALPQTDISVHMLAQTIATMIYSSWVSRLPTL